METKFYHCKHCGNVVVKHVDSGAPLTCCGDQMTELVPHTTDMAYEKHLPVVTKTNDNTYEIKVGSVLHPMLPEHHICFIYVETEKGGTFFYLENSPEAKYCSCTSKPLAVYEYCNLHGLWKTIVE